MFFGEEEKMVKVKYDKIKGLVVNFVFCEGNFDCCVLWVVKNYVCKYLYFMGLWISDFKMNVVSMIQGDFYGSEKFVVVEKVIDVKIEFFGKDGLFIVLKEKIFFKDGEIIDMLVMN